MNTASTWLTQESFDRLSAELVDRSGPLRSEITNAAREEQGKNEARIRQLKQMLENAQIGTPPSDTGTIAIGHVVTVEFSDGDSERFWLVSREEAVHATMDVYSPDSPLGNAVIGKKQGDKSSFALPNGKEISILIKNVEIYQS